MKNMKYQVVLGLSALALSTQVASGIGAHGTNCSHCSLKAPGSPLDNEFVLGPTGPGKWGSPVMGTGATVTWGYMAGGISTDSGLSVDLSTVLPVGYQVAIQAAFDAWSAIADITFIQGVDNGVAFNAGGTTVDIRVGAHAMDGPSGTLAHGYYPPNNGLTAAGDIHFDSAENWVLGFGLGGFDVFQVMAHEIGHAIGLDHSAVPSSLMNPFYTEAFAGLQADDIAGAQFIYGVAVLPPPGVPEGGALVFAFGAAVFGMMTLRTRKA